MKTDYILVINPGATSTKIAVFRSGNPVFLKTIRHQSDALLEFGKVTDQLDLRMGLVIKELEDNHIPGEAIGIIVARGGLLRPIQSGIYRVNEAMVKDLRESPFGEHASNLGGLIAARLREMLPSAEAYIADPVVVDELQDVARISGHPRFSRSSIFHALNQKSIARTHAHSRGMDYEDLNMVVAHLGSGISVGAHRKGKVVDVNNALNGEGPFGPERSGTLPAGDLVRYCFEDGSTLEEVLAMLAGKGGIFAYMGHKEANQLEKEAMEGNAKARLIHEALAYQVGKEIGSMAAVLEGEVHAILLTGGMAHNKGLTELIRKHVGFIAPVFIYPGEDEMKALALNGAMILEGQAVAREYASENFVEGLDLDNLS